MQTLTSFALTTAILPAFAVGSCAQAAIEGRTFSDASFGCGGTINAVAKPNSSNPSAFGQVHTIIDLPGNRTATLSGTIALGPDRGDSANLKLENAPIDRCHGVGDLEIGLCSGFKGIGSCEVTLTANNARIRIYPDCESFTPIFLPQHANTRPAGWPA